MTLHLIPLDFLIYEEISFLSVWLFPRFFWLYQPLLIIIIVFVWISQKDIYICLWRHRIYQIEILDFTSVEFWICEYCFLEPPTEVKLVKNCFWFSFSSKHFYAPVPAEFTMLLQYYTQQGFRVIGAACKQLKVTTIVFYIYKVYFYSTTIIIVVT